MCHLLASTFCGLASGGPIAAIIPAILGAVWPILLIALGFSAVIFIHELGHFAAAKWCGVRVEKFAIGFFREIVGFTRGETRYSLNILPLGGYVKMLGQEDFEVDKSGELRVKDDPRSFTNKPVGRRMIIVSAGVVMNVLFAGLLFMIVFMAGKQGLSTEVGFVRPNWPAAEMGIEVGDVIEEVNGKEIEEFAELNYAIMLAPPLEDVEFQLRRQGKTENVKLRPLNNEDAGVLQIGISPAVTATIGAVGQGVDPARADHFHVNDVVVEINGQGVTEENANEMMYRLISTPFDVKDVVVERPLSDEPDAATERVRVQLPIQFGIYPSDPLDKEAKRTHVLGLAPLTRVASVDEDGRAWLAGLKAGDVILKWGGQWYPTYGDIDKNIEKNGEIDVLVTIERDGKRVPLVIRPKVKRGVFGTSGKPRIGALLSANATGLLRIGAVADTLYDNKKSPASEAGFPRGALITHINDTPVSTWLDLLKHFREHAGSTVTLRYDHDGETGLSCAFALPRTIRTLLDLPPHARIAKIDGEHTVQVEINDRRREIAVSSPFGLREMLKQKLGEKESATVQVTYAESPFDATQTAELTLTEDMIDPWLGRVLYYVDVSPIQATKMIRKGPAGAVKIGAKKTVYFVVSVYHTMQRLIFSRSVGVENLSGPVGIVRIGRSVAERSFVDLLFFLAMISANLAVLNFLPLPIVDGGLMVFLIIEKIKGSPINLKIQMATQVIGLILLGSLFVFVTIQDFTK